MNCKSCGAPLVDGDQFCKNCGAPVDNAGGVTNDTMGGSVPQDNSMNSMDTMSNMGTMNSIDSQNMYSGQPMYEQPMNGNMGGFNQPATAPKQSGGNTKFIIVAVIAIVAICATIFLAMTVNKSNSGSSEPSSGDSGDSGVVPTNNGGGDTEATYSARVGDFTVKIPTSVLSEANGKKLVIGDNTSWAASIETFGQNFGVLKANKDKIVTNIQNGGYTAKNLKDEAYEGLNIISVEVSNGTQTELFAYAQANASYVFGVEVIEETNIPNYDRLKTIAKILKTATYEASSNSISSDIKLDHSAIVPSEK